MNIAAALERARLALAPVSESAPGDAQHLLCHVLGTERAFLLAHGDAELSEAQAATFDALVARCAVGEPLPYVLGRWAWYDRTLRVSPAVLIPRPETELLLEQALAWGRELNHRGTEDVGTRNGASAADKVSAPIAVDVGTGSGALAVTFAAHMPGWSVYALDISPAALAIARQNVDEQGVQVQLQEADLLAQWRAEVPIDLLIANLPYIPSAEAVALPVARHEPMLALDGGEDGLVLIRRLLAQAAQHLRPGGLALLEIMSEQGEAARNAARAVFPAANIAILTDYGGHDRILRIEL
jgi:release factor glutamine methyltransferase